MSRVRGDVLAEPAFVERAIAAMSASWGTDAARVGGTLWWCMLASALVDPVIRARLVNTAEPTMALDSIECELRPDGGIDRVYGTATTEPTALHQTLATVIDQVATVSGAGKAALWAVVADAIGNRALDAAGTQAHGAKIATELAADIGTPTPRFIEVNARTFVNRISCCLVFEVPTCEMCTSCPKRPKAERDARLARI
ncbi:Fe-S oxidoreductase [Nocardia camponoti]|uniref:Fe-S oxidoreductase n=2 Tax=Nocardia camponoti TaxID=1616106 RepID=A0A917QAM6_9NOCA|nr:Fe-S oxidoreductase [Nocardia camponoti]